MCSIILAHQFDEEYRWLLAANRDEKLDRPSEGPAVRDRAVSVFAPRDLQEGGTWLGVNEFGTLAAITNRFGPARDDHRKSRGELVFDALDCRTAKEAADLIHQRAAHDYNGFHLVVADQNDALVVWSDLEALHLEVLEPGIHVVTERSFGAAENGRADFIRDRIEELRAENELSPASLVGILSVCRPSDIDATCVRIPAMNYGTRSSTLAAVGESSFFHYADGPPCEVEFDDLSADFRELLDVKTSRQKEKA